MKYEFHIHHAEELWETRWHSVLFTKDEVERLFLNADAASRCWRRNGGQWQRSSARYGEILRPDIDAWMRENCGHRSGEVWECDRYYYPHEKLPELPTGLMNWRKHFICYPDRDGSYYTHGWNFGETHEPGYRRFISFRDNEGHGKVLATIFAMMFM